ncbi:hypothetical protein [Rhodococcoides kyotonense]|uniref:Uncharacterized protein n=1 Tax=Rhodococcoides kyotonense TaxID=398843 RepID=A0A239FSG0_9NOCA|nr:hypothetical protein [Rhodococcus kyotonensis]SNS59907.1 hypothetical protein SAMN05421642_103440 [Rhodococcus kyotonensis]
MKRVLVFVPIILVGAVIQALLVVGDPVPTTSWGFMVRALASTVVSIALVWLIVGIANNRLSGRLLVATAVAVIAGIAAGVLNPVLALLVAVIALPVLTAAGSLKNSIRTIRFAPIRSFLGFAWAAMLLIVDVVAALLLGFFVTGPVAAGLTWIVFGISAVILAVHWASLHRRAHASRPISPTSVASRISEERR